MLPIDDFLAHEVDDHVRTQLLTAIAQVHDGQRYFTFNTFNVLLDADASTVTVEDELDVERQSTVALDEFESLLHNSEAS